MVIVQGGTHEDYENFGTREKAVLFVLHPLSIHGGLSTGNTHQQQDKRGHCCCHQSPNPSRFLNGMSLLSALSSRFGKSVVESDVPLGGSFWLLLRPIARLLRLSQQPQSLLSLIDIEEAVGESPRPRLMKKSPHGCHLRVSREVTMRWRGGSAT